MLFGKRTYCALCELSKNVSCMKYVHKEIGICRACADKLETTADKTFSASGEIGTVLSPYIYTGALRDAIKKFKFGGQRLYGELFGIMMADELKEHTELCDFDFIVPVPLHAMRLADRGYNQSEIMAESFAEKIGVPVRSDVLFRMRNTERQSRLRGKDRVENVKDAFTVFGNDADKKRILLLDDIYTLGATASACAAALKAGGAAEVIAIAFSVANP